MWSPFALFASQGRFDFGTFHFRQLFLKSYYLLRLYKQGKLTTIFCEN